MPRDACVKTSQRCDEASILYTQPPLQWVLMSEERPRSSEHRMELEAMAVTFSYLASFVGLTRILSCHLRDNDWIFPYLALGDGSPFSSDNTEVLKVKPFLTRDECLIDSGHGEQARLEHYLVVLPNRGLPAS